jgi:hypothetical protein
MPHRGIVYSEPAVSKAAGFFMPNGEARLLKKPNANSGIASVNFLLTVLYNNSNHIRLNGFIDRTWWRRLALALPLASRWTTIPSANQRFGNAQRGLSDAAETNCNGPKNLRSRTIPLVRTHGVVRMERRSQRPPPSPRRDLL